MENIRHRRLQNPSHVRCTNKVTEPRTSLVKRDEEQLVNHLFWQSMLLTLTTPLARFVRGRWTSGSLFYWVLPLLEGTGWVDNKGTEPYFPFYQFVYKTDETVPGIDLAFGLHAFCGLLWILTAWVQVYFLKNSQVWHKMFGKVAILSFILHMMASLNNLYFDYMKHRLLPRLLLLMICMNSMICMVTAIIRVRRKDITGHKDAMMRCFIYSIEGAGTIRWIANIQELLGLGPTSCHNLLNGFSTSCTYSYCWRLIFTRYLSMYFLWLYTNHRNSEKFSRSFYLELVWVTVISVVLYDHDRLSNVDMMLQSNPSFVIPLLVSICTLVKIAIFRVS